MNKSGHLMITEDFSPKICQKHRFFMKLGSILPDLLPGTYLTGHTWTASLDKIYAKMKRLEWNGKMNAFSFLTLGYILHYIEDYFTYPHNIWFDGSLADHVVYEKKFSEYIRSKKTSPIQENKNSSCAMSAELLLDYLYQTHKDYEKEVPGFENDLNYISRTARKVGCSYLPIFVRNQHIAEAMDIAEKGNHPSFITKSTFFF